MQKMSNIDNIRLFTGAVPVDGVTIRPHRTYQCAELAGVPKDLRDKDGELLDSAILKPNQRVVLGLAAILGKRCVSVTINPELLKVATCQVQSLIPAGEPTGLILTVSTHKSVDLNAIAYLVRLFAHD